MKRYSELNETDRLAAVDNQYQIGLNLAAKGDYGGLADYLGVVPDARVLQEVAETLRLAGVNREDPMQAVRKSHGRAISRAATERAMEAYYREPGDLVVGLHDRVRAVRPGSTGRVKIRVLEAHEGGSDNQAPQDKVYGIFVDDQLLVGTVRCVARQPEELWAGFDREGNRISPTSLFKPKAVRRQKMAVRGWMLTHFNERAERGEFDHLLGR